MIRGFNVSMSQNIDLKRNKPAHHDLEPPSGRDGLERREAARRHVGELEVLRDGEVAREADAGLWAEMNSSCDLCIAFRRLAAT